MASIRVTTTYTHSAVIDVDDDFDPANSELTAEEWAILTRDLDVEDLDLQQIDAEWEHA